MAKRVRRRSVHDTPYPGGQDAREPPQRCVSRTPAYVSPLELRRADVDARGARESRRWSQQVEDVFAEEETPQRAGARHASGGAPGGAGSARHAGHVAGIPP